MADKKDKKNKERKEKTIKGDKSSLPFKTSDKGEDKKKGGFFSRFKRHKGGKGGSKHKEGADEKKKAKRQKVKTVPIVYKKPAGKLTTEVDDMLEIISNKKKISINKLAKQMKVKKSEVKEWTETLENWGIIEIHYPLFGDPVLTMAKKKVKTEEEKSE
jgi:hypothetical protein